ncbi:MAG: DUF4238 domain-containing protein [Armatimonadetes bacterium]|nr:DUF4238 domain-containing protein [Armatimonadota bacterium]
MIRNQGRSTARTLPAIHCTHRYRVRISQGTNIIHSFIHSVYLSKVPYIILETSDPIGFITSDNPVVWFDPAAYQPNPPFGAGGMISPTMETNLPLSPRQLLVFGNRLLI